MIKGEDVQMMNDDEISSTVENSTVLVANSSTAVPNVGNNQAAPPSASLIQYNNPLIPSQHVMPQTSQGNFQSFQPPQQFYQSRGFSKGRGGRGYSKGYPREPCGICGKTNHITPYCYYRPQSQMFDQWKGPSFNQFGYSHPQVMMHRISFLVFCILISCLGINL